MTPLDTLRADIDQIDDALHDLLMRRAAIVQHIAARKAADGMPATLRPGREAAILRRLLARHQGPLPPATILRIWREMLAGSLTVQGPAAIATCSHLAAVAREQFGALTPLQTHPTPLAALAAIRAGAASVAVLPLADGAPWWPALLTTPRLHVIARLPFWRPRPPGAPQQEALAVGATPPDPSGRDRTLIAVPAANAPPAPELTPTTRDGEPWLLAHIDGWLTEAAPSAHVLGAYACPLDQEGLPQ